MTNRLKKENLTLILKNELQNVDTNINNFQEFINIKINSLYEIIQNTFISLEMYNSKELFSNSETNQHFEILQDLYRKTQILSCYPITTIEQIDKVIDDLQKIFDKLSAVISIVGTKYVSDILYIVFGAKYDSYQSIDISFNPVFASKMRIIKQYIMPIGYKTTPWKNPSKLYFGSNTCSDKITDTTAQLDISPHIECFEPSTLFTSLHQSIYGMRIVIHNYNDTKTIIMHGQSENIPIHCIINEPFIKHRINEIQEYFDNLMEQAEQTDPADQADQADPADPANTSNNANLQNTMINGEIVDIDRNIVRRWIETLALKDILVYSLDDLYKKYRMMLIDVKYVKENRVDTIIKHFFDMDILSKRKMLAHLFTYNKDNEVQYISYMLYDMIGVANTTTDSMDNREQKMVYDSLPWKLKMYFKETMVNTIQFSQDAIAKCDMSKVSLEQQVLLMRTDDRIKERALAKLKEIKGKSDDQGGKAKQYLEGLVRVPFGQYRREPILTKVDQINGLFTQITSDFAELNLPKKTKYTIYEMTHYIQTIVKNSTPKMIEYLTKLLPKLNKSVLVNIVAHLENSNIPFSGSKLKPAMIAHIMQHICTNTNTVLKLADPVNPLISIHDQADRIVSEIDYVHNSMDRMKERLDKSIYGHQYAKSQIMKIVGQWINGEQNGYCFGFEGSPGIGKTSLAKRGLAQCLQDEFGEARPFAFIALGGSCNGSTLEGHNYTYVNSLWGKIVDILMESKCMNPIIYVDELDKVSKTEQGREIIGILTHLIDTTQNDEFQDRYFSGIPFDLSKALFIFSYNDPEQIDRILLDRIHRIKFDNLSWSEKLVIVKQFILPELNKRMGFENVVELPDTVVEHIVEQYTMEPGIRKLKEILFDLYGEINIELLEASQNNIININSIIKLPIQINVQDLGTIHGYPVVGMINGMWANALGKGGIIPVETMFFPSSTFLDLKLTGLQGDVMKESMNVAKSLAWSLTPVERQKELVKQFESSRNQGLHIHCP